MIERDAVWRLIEQRRDTLTGKPAFDRLEPGESRGAAPLALRRIRIEHRAAAERVRRLRIAHDQAIPRHRAHRRVEDELCMRRLARAESLGIEQDDMRNPMCSAAVNMQRR